MADQTQTQPQTQQAPPPAPAAAPTPAMNHNTHAAGGPIDQHDIDDWKARVNDVLARPSEHINSKSQMGAQGWASGFFDCFNPIDTCLVTYFLPCVTFGKTHHRVRKNANLEGYEPINTSCLLFCGSLCCALQWIPLSMQRSNLREKYNLEGSCLVDIATSCCCGCCSIIQQDKEAQHREQLLQTAGIQEQYQANPTEMSYAPK